MARPSTIIIAEAGVNHNGSLDRAMEMVHAACDAGADYVKFQTFVPELLIAASAPKAEYQKQATGSSETQLEMLQHLSLGLDAFPRLAAECEQCGIGFLSTPFDLTSIDALAPLGMDYWKIPSGEITNLPYLRKIARQGGRVIMSTGMSTLDEVRQAMKVLTDEGIPTSHISLLHCNTQYPTPFEDVNLRAMEQLRLSPDITIGYSDHTLGIAVPVAAVALGARIIEKHFTLDRSLPGPDHRASLEPSELRAMVQAIRQVEQALGSPDKHVTPSERPNIAVARKSIVAARPIAKGEIFTEQNLTVKRPGTGLSPMLWDEVLGQPAPDSFLPDDLITLN